ncbi:hypothetical protein HOLleu_26145 [Holothuria leucospilota]|uniref:Uncharacterized protein n=1 Tax=Holothuria leucospilota TaxID=206669 RepID=A0A9Q1BTW6_HOLLE|nr:hypothetical protein HOLleu_26145 [Holothuria leucospilota]
MVKKLPLRSVKRLSKSPGVLFSGFVMVFLQSGTFKACGVLLEDVVKRYDSSYLFGGWVFTFQPAFSFITARYRKLYRVRSGSGKTNSPKGKPTTNMSSDNYYNSRNKVSASSFKKGYHKDKKKSSNVRLQPNSFDSLPKAKGIYAITLTSMCVCVWVHKEEPYEFVGCPRSSEVIRSETTQTSYTTLTAGAGICGSVITKASNRTMGVVGGILFGLGFVLEGIFGNTMWHLFFFTGVTDSDDIPYLTVTGADIGGEQGDCIHAHPLGQLVDMFSFLCKYEVKGAG